MRLRLAIVAALAADLLGGARLRAADPHWPRGAAILAFIDPKFMPTDADDLVVRAMRSWTTAAQGRFMLQRTTFEHLAKLRVHFFQLTSKFGQTLPEVDPQTGAITDAEVDITAVEQGDPLDRQIVLYLTALHEIGHALGLPHRNDFNSIMYAFRYPNDSERYFGRYRALVKSPSDIGSTATGLSPDDVQVLRSLYDR